GLSLEPFVVALCPRSRRRANNQDLQIWNCCSEYGRRSYEVLMPLDATSGERFRTVNVGDHGHDVVVGADPQFPANVAATTTWSPLVVLKFLAVVGKVEALEWDATTQVPHVRVRACRRPMIVGSGGPEVELARECLLHVEGPWHLEQHGRA